MVLVALASRWSVICQSHRAQRVSYKIWEKKVKLIVCYYPHMSFFVLAFRSGTLSLVGEDVFYIHPLLL